MKNTGCSSTQAGDALSALLNLPAAMMVSALESLAGAVKRPKQGRGSCGGGKKHGKTGPTSFATTDIQWKAYEGETRVASILVENNRAQATSITLTAQPWIDATGKQISGGGLLLTPSVLNLKAGEAATVEARVQVTPPLGPGMAYYTDIVINGCSRKPISVGLMVSPAGRCQMFVACDPCCGSRPKFVEFCEDTCCEPCCCECGCGGAASCSGCGCCDSCCCCEPCSPWPGCWDPHGHWLDDCNCDWIYVPRASQSRIGSSG
jgi:hypothetical protein